MPTANKKPTVSEGTGARRWGSAASEGKSTNGNRYKRIKLLGCGGPQKGSETATNEETKGKAGGGVQPTIRLNAGYNRPGRRSLVTLTCEPARGKALNGKAKGSKRKGSCPARKVLLATTTGSVWVNQPRR